MVCTAPTRGPAQLLLESMRQGNGPLPFAAADTPATAPARKATKTPARGRGQRKAAPSSSEDESEAEEEEVSGCEVLQALFLFGPSSSVTAALYCSSQRDVVEPLPRRMRMRASSQLTQQRHRPPHPAACPRVLPEPRATWQSAAGLSRQRMARTARPVAATRAAAAAPLRVSTPGHAVFQ